MLAVICFPQERTFPQDCSSNQESVSKQQQLFDGQSLDDWRVTEFGTERPVTVEDGAIVMEAGYPLTGITYAGEVPTDEYELCLQAMKVAGNDFFCAVTFPVRDSHCTLVLGGWGGTTTGLSCIDGKDASDNATTQYVKYEADQWYSVRIRVADGFVRCWLDDQSLADVDLAGKKIALRNEVFLSRPLGICSFATTARIKDIQLVHLSAGADSSLPSPKDDDPNR